MENLPVNPADLVVFAVLLLAALLAFTRGMVAEISSLAAWVGAALITLYARPVVEPMVAQYVAQPMLAAAAAGVAVFAVSLVVLSMLGSRIAARVQQSSLGAVDRSLGFVFGLFKGAILVSLAYLFFIWLVPNQSEHPDWLREARTRTLMATGAEMILDLVPEGLRAEGLAQSDLARERARQYNEAAENLRKLSIPVPGGSKAVAPGAEPGYTPQSRRDLEQAIQNQLQQPPR